MLAVIPARGGSKGVPKKNIRDLNGKPLIAYTITAALSAGIFDRVIVSTDDEEIAAAAAVYGAEVPFLRPTDLSGDTATSDAVILHALDYFSALGQNYAEVCKLQPTSPLRTEDHIREAYRLFRSKNADFVVSVCECEHSPLWSDPIGDDLSMENFMQGLDKSVSRQDLPTYYRLNGAIYMARSSSFRSNGSFIGKGGFAYIMDQADSVDIDSMIDFKLAALLLEERNALQS